MNAIDDFLTQCDEGAQRPALWTPDAGTLLFGELRGWAASVQKICRRAGVQTGDAVLLFESIGPRLYAAVIGILGLGASVMLVEPWMKTGQVNDVVVMRKPKLFLTNLLGMAWGARFSAVRAVPAWRNIRRADTETGREPMVTESMDAGSDGMVAFTSGTSGHPKGVVRSHGLLTAQRDLIIKHLGMRERNGADLTIFSSFVMINLCAGRPSLIVPHHWSTKVLKKISSLGRDLKPVSLVTGPAFLNVLLGTSGFETLEAVHVGGALTDCAPLEEAFQRWPDAQWDIVYGSSEAEPVAHGEARECVARSRKEGHFQVLHLGRPVPELQYTLEEDAAWVTGNHVCRRYLGDDESNRKYKRTDDQGRVWHCMGDRIVEDSQGWWYGGRTGDSHEDFLLEQQIYGALGSSAAFLHRTRSGELSLLGENVKGREGMIRDRFRGIKSVIEARVYRDRRHRAKIDRQKSLRKGASWLLG